MKMTENDSLTVLAQYNPTQAGSILYQDEEAACILLDLPCSISFAQRCHDQHSAQSLLSCEPLREPHMSTEPKTASASARLKNQASSLIKAEKHEDLIRLGLQQIHKHWENAFCLPRTIHYSDENDASKTQRNQEGDRRDEPQLFSKPLDGVATCTELSASQVFSISTTGSLQAQCFSNPHSHSSSLYISATDATYRVPPFSSFINTSLSAQTSSLLSLALLSVAPLATGSVAAGEFDLILLDPPWPNRSARRAAPYNSVSNAQDPFCGFGDVLPQHLAAGGFVVCWITHAQAIRDQVEAAFDEWNAAIVEEWTWSKVTCRGEPVVALGSQWRRSWEVLVVGQKRDAGILSTQNQETLTRRLIVAVPDLHSRKPCLKEVFEQTLLRHRRGARVLEVFARHLVAGWCSVGNEVLRFNWEGHWARLEHSL